MYNGQHNSCMIVFSSSTSLHKAENLLKNAGIAVEETRPPSGLTGGSCAYALSMQEKNTASARRLLTGVPHGGIYCRMNGGYREV